jgi:hypothetical protein
LGKKKDHPSKTVESKETENDKKSFADDEEE